MTNDKRFLWTIRHPTAKTAYCGDHQELVALDDSVTYPLCDGRVTSRLSPFAVVRTVSLFRPADTPPPWYIAPIVDLSKLN